MRIRFNLSTRAVLPLTALALAATALACPGACAAYDPLASGATTITLAKPFASLLAAHGVKLEAKAGAERRGNRLVLPASGGEVDPRLGLGTIESPGTVIFAAGRFQVPFRHLTFKAKRAPLYAKVGGGQLKIATSTGVKARRRGFGAAFSAAGLRLSAKVATRLDKKLHLGQALQAGQLIGKIEALANPATVHLLPQGRLSLALDPAFYAKLNSLFVSLNPIAPAELGPGPTLSFPVGLESTLAPDGGAGIVKLGGAAELLQLGAAQIFWRELWLEPGTTSLAAETDVEPSPPNPGKQPQDPLLALAPGAAVASDPSARTISISAQAATLTAATAAALNAAFAKGSPSFEAGEVVGTLSLGVTAE